MSNNRGKLSRYELISLVISGLGLISLILLVIQTSAMINQTRNMTSQTQNMVTQTEQLTATLENTALTNISNREQDIFRASRFTTLLFLREGDKRRR
jgi:hypothetical protein